MRNSGLLRPASVNLVVPAVLTAAWLCLVVIPLLQKGTFIDGMIYKTVSYNYFRGWAEFWNMKFTDTSMTFFCEQPPLYFYLLGTAYKTAGFFDLTDRLFTLLLLLLLHISVYALCKVFARKRGLSYFYLMSFFFLLSPLTWWTYANQLIEPLVCILTVNGVYLFVKQIVTGNRLYSFLFSVNLCLLFLSKGFQSCFIAVLPLAYIVLDRKRKDMIFMASFSVLTLAVFLAMVLEYYGPSSRWFDCYYQARLVLTMNDIGKTTDQHFNIILRFLLEISAAILIASGLLLYLRKFRGYRMSFALKNFYGNKLAMSLLITSLAGSLPYSVSLVQRGFYLLPAMMVFVIAIVTGLRRYWMFVFYLSARLMVKRSVQIFALVFLAGSCIYLITDSQKYKRDEALYADVGAMLPYFAEGDTVKVNGDLWNHFTLHSILYMKKRVSLSDQPGEFRYMMRYRSDTSENRNTELIPLETSGIELLRIISLH